MNDHEARETRILQPHPNAEQKSLVTDVVVPLATAAINTAGVVIAAKIVTGNGDDKK